MGMYGFLPVVLIGGAIVSGLNHVWVLAAVLIVMAVFGIWLIWLYGSSERMGR